MDKQEPYKIIKALHEGRFNKVRAVVTLRRKAAPLASAWIKDPRMLSMLSHQQAPF